MMLTANAQTKDSRPAGDGDQRSEDIQLNTDVDFTLSTTTTLKHCYDICGVPAEILSAENVEETAAENDELVKQRLRDEGIVIVDPNISPPPSNRPNSEAEGDSADEVDALIFDPPSTSATKQHHHHRQKSVATPAQKRLTARELKRKSALKESGAPNSLAKFEPVVAVEEVKRRKIGRSGRAAQKHVVLELAARRQAMMADQRGVNEATSANSPSLPLLDQNGITPLMGRFLQQLMTAGGQQEQQQHDSHHEPQQHDALLHAIEHGWTSSLPCDSSDSSGIFSADSPPAGEYGNSTIASLRDMFQAGCSNITGASSPQLYQASPLPELLLQLSQNALLMQQVEKAKQTFGQQQQQQRRPSQFGNGRDNEAMAAMLTTKLQDFLSQQPAAADACSPPCGAAMGSNPAMLQAIVQACMLIASACNTGVCTTDWTPPPSLDASTFGQHFQSHLSRSQPAHSPPASQNTNSQQLALNWLFSTLLQQHQTTAQTPAASDASATTNGGGAHHLMGMMRLGGSTSKSHGDASRGSSRSSTSQPNLSKVGAHSPISYIGQQRRDGDVVATNMEGKPLALSPVSKSTPHSHGHTGASGKRPPAAVNKNTVKSLAQQGHMAIGDEVQLMDLEELEAFANNFKKQRLKHGFTQGDIGMALGRRYGTDFSQTTISRFEALNLSYKNMCKLRPLLKEWLEETEAMLENGATVTDVLESPMSTAGVDQLSGVLQQHRTQGQPQILKGSMKLEQDDQGMHYLPNYFPSDRHQANSPALQHHLQQQQHLFRAGLVPHLKRRRKRTNLDNVQRNSLDAFFELNPRPDHQRMLEIANELDLDADVVRVWFCNRRQKLRKVEEA